MSLESDAAGRLTAFLQELPKQTVSRIHIFCDSDCDGLPAGALLLRALRLAGYTHGSIECKRKGESAWLPEVIDRLRAAAPDCLFILDMGCREEPLLPGIPTMIIDHHRPSGIAPAFTVLTGYGVEPTPTTGLLVYWAVAGIMPSAARAGMLWLAALSLLSDLGDKAPFAELAEARIRYSAAAMRSVVSLVNAPRRTASADATEALSLLLEAESPKQILGGTLPQLARLQAAREEVSTALLTAKKAAPKFSRKYRDNLGADLVALTMNTPCQVHPLVAQTWRGRFPAAIVMGVNFGFRPGYVHFSARGPKTVNVIQFLREHAPPGVDQGYGNGHDQASGGAVPIASWNAFADDLGFGPELQLPT